MVNFGEVILIHILEVLGVGGWVGEVWLGTPQLLDNLVPLRLKKNPPTQNPAYGPELEFKAEASDNP